MVRNVLEAVTAKPNGLRHVGLVTGTKHYLDLLSLMVRTSPTHHSARTNRLPLENFYYTQEDLVFEFAARFGFSWTVYRPHTIVGYAVGNAMNLGVTLATYASICRATGRPFLFPGSPTYSTTAWPTSRMAAVGPPHRVGVDQPFERNEAFNVVNGDVFRWQRMWNVIACYFEIEPAPTPAKPSRSNGSWPTRDRSGTGSSPNTNRNRSPSIGSPRPGTPMPTLAARSNASTTSRKAAASASRVTNPPSGHSSTCSTNSGKNA